jgi:hypothetical protein
MDKPIIFFVLSPYRAQNYDFEKLILPEESDLLIITDHKTIIDYNLERFNTHPINISPLGDTGYDFLSVDALDELIEKYIKSGYSKIKLHCDEELYLEHIAELNEKYNLEGIHLKEMLKYRNKFIMKLSHKNMGCKLSRIPKFSQDVNEATHFNFPVFIKPTSLAAALDTKKIDTPEQLIKYTQKIEMHNFIIEEFIDGILFHCDALVYKNSMLHFFCARYFDPLSYAGKYKEHAGSEIINSGEIYYSPFVIPRLDRGIHSELCSLARFTRLDSGFLRNDG